jgi:hypothetical protein
MFIRMRNSVVMSLIKLMASIRWRSGAYITRKVENTQTCMTSILIRPLPGRIASHVPSEPIIASSSIIQHMLITFFWTTKLWLSTNKIIKLKTHINMYNTCTFSKRS